MKTKAMNKIIENIKAKRSPPNFPIKIVVVDGHGGSGKSTLAKELAGALNAEILHTDDFASWDNPLDWWSRLVDEVLEPMKSGVKILNYERSKWAENHNPDPVRNQPVTPIMILEGVSSARKEFRPYLTYAVWVDTPRDVCLRRGLERDGQHMRDQWEKWLKDQDEYIERDKPQKYADIIMSGAK